MINSSSTNMEHSSLNDFETLLNKWGKLRKRAFKGLWVGLALAIAMLFLELILKNLNSDDNWLALRGFCIIAIGLFVLINYWQSVFIARLTIKSIKNTKNITDEMCDFQDKMKGEWIVAIWVTIWFMPLGLFELPSPQVLRIAIASIIIIIGFSPAITNYFNQVTHKPKDEIGNIIFKKTGLYANFVMLTFFGFLLLICNIGPDFLRDFVENIFKAGINSAIKFLVFIWLLAFGVGKFLAHRKIFGW